MVTSLTGSNSFALQKRLDEIIQTFIKEHGELAVERVDVEEKALANLLEEIQNLPFLAAKKLVVLKGLSGNKAAAEAVEQIINSTGEQTELVIVEPSPDKRSSFYKTLHKKTQMEDFEETDAASLAKWAVDEAKHLGAVISFADAKWLIDKIGANQQLLASELSKLAIYSPKITRENIELMVDSSPQSKVFDLLDAAFAGKKERALDIYKDQRSQRVEPQYILGMIAWQLRALAAVKLGGSKPKGVIAKDFGINPYVVDKTSRLAGGISLNRLKGLIEDALEMDYKSKTIAYDLDDALQNYLLAIS